MGRPRKTLATNKKHFTVAEKDERRRIEEGYKVGRAALEDFSHLEQFGLDDAARAEYERLVSAAHWLDDLDRDELIAYAIAWSRAVKIATSADAHREVLALTRGDGSKRLIRNPLWQAWRECCADMRAISLKLGLAQIDRLKLVDPAASEQPPENKFLRFLEVRP